MWNPAAHHWYAGLNERAQLLLPGGRVASASARSAAYQVDLQALQHVLLACPAARPQLRLTVPPTAAPHAQEPSSQSSKQVAQVAGRQHMGWLPCCPARNAAQRLARSPSSFSHSGAYLPYSSMNSFFT